MVVPSTVTIQATSCLICHSFCAYQGQGTVYILQLQLLTEPDSQAADLLANPLQLLVYICTMCRL
jgi:hypothetical protein